MPPPTYAHGCRVTCAPHRCQRDAVHGAGVGAVASEADAVDPLTRQAEEGRKERDRGDHHDEDDDGRGDARGGHERNAGDGETEDRDDDGAAGEDHRQPGRRHRAADRFLDRRAPSEELTVPGDEEQRVVDADAEADHARHLRCPARDVDEVGDERHRADAESQAKERHPDRQPHGDERSERHQQDDDRHDQADDLARAGLGLLEREEQVAAHLDLQRRALPQLDPELLEVLEVARVEILDHRVLHADQRDATVR